MTVKPPRTPWDSEPFVDPAVATSKAIAAATGVYTDPKSPGVQNYARRVFNDEIALVRNPPGNYNDQLFKSGANLYELVAAGALAETEVTNALRDAMRDNGYERDKGVNAVEATIKSAHRTGFDSPRDLSHVGTKRRSAGVLVDSEPAETVSLDEIAVLERGFWTQRESLQTIYLAALSKMCSPWAVLGHCAARALALVRPQCRLPPIIGGVGSLNWFCAIAAKSGGGKDSAMAVAEQLVRHDILTRNLGSGEGVIDSYVIPKNKETGEPQSLHESIMFVADEIDTMATLSQRSGATLPSILRSGFSGGTLGFSYRTASSLHLEKHTYRMTLVVSVQPAKAGALMDDIYGGTLQRFMWFPGSDSRITNEPPPMPGKLELPSPAAWQYERELLVPYEAVELIRDERVRINTGAADDINGHALYIREKFAYALAVLDGRDELTSEDWRLAGIASRVSDHTRTWVASELLAAQERKATEEGRLQGVRYNASDEERAHQSNKRLTRIAVWARKKIRESETGITQRALTQAMASRDRPYLATALDKLEATGVIAQRDKRWIWVGENR